MDVNFYDKDTGEKLDTKSFKVWDVNVQFWCNRIAGGMERETSRKIVWRNELESRYIKIRQTEFAFAGDAFNLKG